MKKLFFSLVALMAATVNFAQNTLVATLTHGDDVTMYYGINALREAHEAAASGDVINLSGGAFQAVNITKGITLRGVGIDMVNPTYITNDFTINIPTEDSNRLIMEGICCSNIVTMAGTFSNPYFLKCKLKDVYYDDNSVIKNTVFVNCKIYSGYNMGGTACSTQFVNSFIQWVSNQSTSSVSLTNCVLGWRPDLVDNTQITNCIVVAIHGYEDRIIGSTCTAINSVSIGFRSNVFGNSPANTGNKTANYEEIFKDYTGTYSDSQTFELTDEAKAFFWGTDGTEVGMYGGLMPYSSTPTYPQITKMNVANKTTADGKLSVEIEVNAAQQ